MLDNKAELPQQMKLEDVSVLLERASMFQGIYEDIWSMLRQGGVY